MTDKTPLSSVWDDIDAEIIEAPLARVCVLEDRAQITRRTLITLAAGETTFAVAGVTPLLADRILRCRVRPVDHNETDLPRITDIKVERRYVVEAARPERHREILNAVDKLVDNYLETHDEANALAHERRLIDSATVTLCDQARARLGIGTFDRNSTAELAKLWSRLISLDESLLAHQWRQDDRLVELSRLHEELYAALQPVSSYQAALLTALSVPKTGEYSLEWEYMVPCAMWRPSYIAELAQKDATHVRWTSMGTVWQATGEDWSNIELSFSTARPSVGAKLPLLSDDVLRARDKSDEEKKTIQVTSRDEAIETTTSAEQKSDTPPGLDDGGEARLFEVPGRVDVPGDGRPHQITFESWSATAQAELTCMPERAPLAYLRSLQANGSAMPLLAGPVSLVKEGGYVGRSSIRYVAPDERFALSWGSEDGLVVLRDVVKKQEDKGIRKRHHHSFKVEVYLTNHTDTAKQLKLQERIPVSEIGEVEVDLSESETTRGFEVDDQGILTWKPTLPAGAEQKYQLAFEVRMPQNVRWGG